MGELPGAINGYLATQQEQQQRQAQQFAMIKGLMDMQGQQEDRQQRQQLFPLELKEREAKVKKLQDDAEMNAQLGPLIANGGAGLTADQYRAVGMRMAVAGHPGSPAWLANAERMDQRARDQATMESMKTQQGVTPNYANDDEGNALPVVQGRPGMFDALAQSPYAPIAQAARNYQQQINSGNQGMTPQQANAHNDRLTNLAVSQAGQDARLDKRQDQRIEIRNMAPAGDTSPYTNVQSDGKGGFVGLNKRTMRMESIPMAAGASMAGYGPQAPGAEQLTGDAYLKSLSAGDAAIVKAVAEGRTPVTDLSTKGGHREAIIKMVNQYVPGFDSVMARANATSLNKLIPQYDAVTSFEKNAVRNGEVLMQLADKVDTTGVPLIERWIRAGRRATGNDDIAEFGAQLQIYRTEAARILTNPNLTGVLSDSARKEVEGFIAGDSSASQIKRVVKRLQSDFENRRTTLEDQIRDNRTRSRTGQIGGQSASGPGFDDLPPANSSNKGKRIQDSHTGDILVSDGMSWKKAAK